MKPHRLNISCILMNIFFLGALGKGMTHLCISYFNVHIVAAYLNVHLDNRLPNECCTKKSPEGDQKMSTCYSCQVKKGIWNLGGNHLYN